jgi:hypothetical protein
MEGSTAVGAFCCFEGLRSSRAGFYFSFHEKREVNKRNSPAGCSEAKIGYFFPKSTKRSHFVALNGGRFFTGKSTQFLYASPQRPELIRGTKAGTNQGGNHCCGPTSGSFS